jgi:O-antigen/teichoic acid export membrane protein
MQRHVRLNAINITNSLLKYGGGLLILVFVSPTITAFFLWQLIISAFVIIFLVISVWSSLPPKEGKPSFNQQLLQRIWKFALSMNLISFIGLIIHQIDKLFVSHFFLLNIFGYYNLATTVASGFIMLVSPISLTFFPKLSTLVAQKDEKSLRRVYHQACQLVSAAILPAATTGILFSHKIITLWTGDPSIADKTAPIASILLLGTALNSLTTLPYQAQISHGWTRLALFSNLFSLPVIVALLFGLNSAYSILGVALIWPIHNLYMLVVTVPLMHRRILKGEFSAWLIKDTGIPVFICFVFASIVTFGGAIIPDCDNNVFVLIGFALITQIGVIFALSFTREKTILFIQTLTRKALHGF